MRRGPAIPDRPYLPGEDLPAVCTVAHAAWVFGVSATAVHAMRERGHLRDFLLPSLGDKKFRYSGVRLKQWATGEFQPGRTFGQSRLRHATSVAKSA